MVYEILSVCVLPCLWVQSTSQACVVSHLQTSILQHPTTSCIPPPTINLQYIQYDLVFFLTHKRFSLPYMNLFNNKILPIVIQVHCFGGACVFTGVHYIIAITTEAERYSTCLVHSMKCFTTPEQDTIS